MRISSHLPQFEDKRTLLVVAGKRAARLYFAHKGFINEVYEMRTPTPVYSDREGFFMRRGRGEQYGSGSVYESKDSSTQDKFETQLREVASRIMRAIQIDSVILFAPAEAIYSIRKELPHEIKRKIESSVRGNYVHDHPHSFLQKLNEKEMRPVHST